MMNELKRPDATNLCHFDLVAMKVFRQFESNVLDDPRAFFMMCAAWC